MTQTKLIRRGDEHLLIIDDMIAKQLQLKEKTKVEITTVGQSLVITPVRRKPARSEASKNPN